VLLWVGGIVLFLILLVIVAVQIILMSDLPRRVLVNAASKSLGLKIEAKSFRAGWWGHSRLTGLTAALPLADHPFLHVPEVEVDNTSLLVIALTQSVDIDELVIKKPVVDVVQRPTGQWNVQEVADLFAAKNKSKDEAAKKSSGPPKLPRLVLQEATINVADNRGRRTTIQPLEARGEPDGALAYSLHVESPGRLGLDGTVALNRTFHQQFNLRVQGVGEWVKPWVNRWPQSASVSAAWDGAVSPSGRLEGQLSLQPLQVGPRTLRGVTNVTFDQGQLVLHPDSLLLTTGLAEPVNRVDLRAGQIVVGGGEVKVQQLLAALADGSMQINAEAALSGQRASMEARWQELHLPAGIDSSGHLSASLRTPWPGQPDIRLDLTSTGASPQGPWKTSLNVHGRGASYAALDWTIQSKGLTIDRPDKKPFQITDFLAQVNMREGKVSLTELSLRAPARLSGHGAYDLATNSWWLWIDSSGWPVGGGDTFGFSINVWGDPKFITLHQLYAHSGSAELVGSGYYGFTWPKPLDLNLYASHPPTDWNRPQSGPIQGRFHGYVDAAGTLKPLAVDLSGWLHARNLVVADHAVDDIDARLKGRLQPKASWGHMEMKLAGGGWDIDAIYPGKGWTIENGRWARDAKAKEDPYEGRFARVAVAADGLSLARVAKMAKVNNLSGEAKGNWTIDLPSLSLGKIKMHGAVAAQNVAVAGQRLESVAAATTLERGLFRARNVEIKQAGGQGRVKAAAWIDLMDPRDVEGTFHADNWTVDLPARKLRLALSAASDKSVLYHLKGRGVDGSISAKAQARIAGEPAGQADLDVSLASGEEQSIDLKRVQGAILGGTVAGHMSARVTSLGSAGDFWKWSDFNGEIRGDHLQLGKADQWSASPFLRETGGTLGFKAVGHPTTRPHPLEPQYFNLKVAADGAEAVRYRDLTFKAADFHVYLGNQRFVFAADPDMESTVWLADGTIYPWLRVSRHTGAGYFALLNGRFDQINLDQIVHAASPRAEPMPGRLAGTFHFQGNLADPRDLNGTATLRIAKSDLVNFDPLALLYNIMNVGGNPKTPIGNGQFDVGLEQSKLTISNGHYFNRGIDAIGSLTINDIWDIKKSPIEGGVVGTARPLKDVKLPLIADADKLLANLQSFLTAVGIDGTLENPKVYQTTLTNFGGGLQKAILGDVKRAKK
jgi:hypothetical protein